MDRDPNFARDLDRYITREDPPRSTWYATHRLHTRDECGYIEVMLVPSDECPGAHDGYTEDDWTCDADYSYRQHPDGTWTRINGTTFAGIVEALPERPLNPVRADAEVTIADENGEDVDVIEIRDGDGVLLCYAVSAPDARAIVEALNKANPPVGSERLAIPPEWTEPPEAAYNLDLHALLRACLVWHEGDAERNTNPLLDQHIARVQAALLPTGNGPGRLLWEALTWMETMKRNDPDITDQGPLADCIRRVRTALGMPARCSALPNG